MISTSLVAELNEVEISHLGATSRRDCSSNPAITEHKQLNVVQNEAYKKTTENSGDFSPRLNGFPRPTLLLQDEQRIA